MKIKWSLDINTGAVERSEAARARSLAGATVGGAKYPSIFGVGVPNTLGYLEWGCKISGGAKYPVTPAFKARPNYRNSHNVVINSFAEVFNPSQFLNTTTVVLKNCYGCELRNGAISSS